MDEFLNGFLTKYENRRLYGFTTRNYVQSEPHVASL